MSAQCALFFFFFCPFPGLYSASTRKLYEKKLQKLLDQPAAEPEAPSDITTLPKADSNQNGNTNSDQYSDKEDGELGLHINLDLCLVTQLKELICPLTCTSAIVSYWFVICFSEDIAAPEPEPVPVVEKPVRSRGKTPVTTRTSSRRQAKVTHLATVILRERCDYMLCVLRCFMFHSGCAGNPEESQRECRWRYPCQWNKHTNRHQVGVCDDLAGWFLNQKRNKVI